MKFKTNNQSEIDFLIDCLRIAEDYYQREYDKAFEEDEEGLGMSYCESRKDKARRWIEKLEDTEANPCDLSFNDLFSDLVSPQQELRAKIAVQVLPWHLGRIANEYEGELRGKWDEEAAKRAVLTADALIAEIQKKSI